LSDGYIYCLIGTSHLGKKWIMNEIVALMIICPLMVMVGLGWDLHFYGCNNKLKHDHGMCYRLSDFNFNSACEDKVGYETKLLEVLGKLVDCSSSNNLQKIQAVTVKNLQTNVQD
jgi:hypothetical protein